MIWSVLLGIALLITIASFCWLLGQIRLLEGILEEFLESGQSAVSDIAETRESKIVSMLRQILRNAGAKEQRAVEDKDQVMALISDLSHQLKTPLANIVMNTELLEKDGMDETCRKDFLIRTRQQAEKMQWLMETLLKTSRLETGSIEFQPRMEKIKATLANAVGAVYAQASRKQIHIEMDEFQDTALYHNPKWTAEAISNILENAVKYSPENSTIKIGFQRQELYSRITIADQGIGIEEQEYYQIFRRFYRGKTAAEEEGSGLGLYLAQLILQKERGYITVNSRRGQGSCFSVFMANN